MQGETRTAFIGEDMLTECEMLGDREFYRFVGGRIVAMGVVMVVGKKDTARCCLEKGSKGVKETNYFGSEAGVRWPSPFQAGSLQSAACPCQKSLEEIQDRETGDCWYT